MCVEIGSFYFVQEARMGLKLTLIIYKLVYLRNYFKFQNRAK